MVLHDCLIRLRIKQDGTIRINPGHAETVSLHIFQKSIAVLFRTGDRQTQFILQLLYLYLREMIMQDTHHNTQTAQQHNDSNQHCRTEYLTCHA